MKQERKDNKLLILMIISWLTLTAFVIYWLSTQYKNGKERLEKELTLLYIESRNEAIDSLLFNILTDNTGKKEGESYTYHNNSGHYQTRNDSLRGNMTLFGKHDSFRPQPVTESHSRRRKIPDAPAPPEGNPGDNMFFRDMTMRNMRMIMDHVADSAEAGSVMKLLSEKLDTTIVKEYFTKKINNAGMNFLVWFNVQTFEPGIPGSGKYIIIRPSPGPFRYETWISGYNGYLISGMMPQIIFGLVLVLLTALAFFFSYRSIREHVVLNSLREEFISNITHELRTPVATFNVALESLGKYNLKEEPQVLDEYLHLLSAETKRLEDLIDRVLDHSRLEKGGQPLDMVATDINAIAREVTDVMRHRTERGSVTFSTEEDAIMITGDPLFLKGVLINLIDNSIKYCDKDPVINIESHKEKGTAVVEVKDNGPGIPKEYHEKIFEKFFRLPTKNVHNVKGYGLGLSFVHKVIALHDGKIEVKNLNPGCSFIIKIPLA